MFMCWFSVFRVLRIKRDVDPNRFTATNFFAVGSVKTLYVFGDLPRSVSCSYFLVQQSNPDETVEPLSCYRTCSVGNTFISSN